MGKASQPPRPGRPCRLGRGLNEATGLSLLLAGTPVNFTLSHIGETLLGGFIGNGDVQIPVNLVSASETQLPTLTDQQKAMLRTGCIGKWQMGPGQAVGTPHWTQARVGGESPQSPEGPLSPRNPVREKEIFVIVEGPHSTIRAVRSLKLPVSF